MRRSLLFFAIVRWMNARMAVRLWLVRRRNARIHLQLARRPVRVTWKQPLQCYDVEVYGHVGPHLNSPARWMEREHVFAPSREEAEKIAFDRHCQEKYRLVPHAPQP